MIINRAPVLNLWECGRLELIYCMRRCTYNSRSLYRYMTVCTFFEHILQSLSKVYCGTPTLLTLLADSGFGKSVWGFRDDFLLLTFILFHISMGINVQ